MCVIMCYKDNYPRLKDLKSAEEINGHGAGIGWIEDGKVKFKKGLTSGQVWKCIKENDIQLPFVIHFRIKSVGDIVSELTHPFPISTNVNDDLEGITDKLFFHNGTYNKWDDDLLDTCVRQGLKIPDGELSDSKALAFLCAVYGDNYLKLINTQSRFTILSKNGIKVYGSGWEEVSKGLCSNAQHVKEEPTKEDIEQTALEKVDYSKKEWVHGKWQYREDKIERKDGNYNVWQNNTLIRVEDKNGNTIPQHKETLIINKEDKRVEEIIEIWDLTPEEQKELYQKTCNDLIDIEGRINTLTFNIKIYERNKEQLREDKKLAKIKSTQNRIQKLITTKIQYMTTLDDLMQVTNDNTEEFSEGWTGY